MIGYICKLTLGRLIDNGLIQEEDLEVYNYGLEILLATIFKLIGLLIIAVIGGIVKESIVFIIFFSSLRVQAGGYHAKSIFNCFIGTLALLLGSIALVRILPLEYRLYYIILSMFISILFIFLYAPLETKNRPLDKEEKIIYKKRSLITVVSGSIIVLFFTYIDAKYTYLGTIALTGFLSESLTLLNFIKNET